MCVDVDGDDDTGSVDEGWLLGEAAKSSGGEATESELWFVPEMVN